MPEDLVEQIAEPFQKTLPRGKRLCMRVKMEAAARENVAHEGVWLRRRPLRPERRQRR